MSLLLRYRSDPPGAVPPVTTAVPPDQPPDTACRRFHEIHDPKNIPVADPQESVPYFCAHRTGGTDLPDSRLDAACWQRLTDVMGRLLSMTPERNEQ